MTTLFDGVVRFEPPKKEDPEKVCELAKTLLDLQRAWFEDAMRRKDERMMSLHAEQMNRLEQRINENCLTKK
jgi:hypothetical protein